MIPRALFYELVCRVCEQTGGSITSAYRTKQRNTKVGGVPTSLHLTGHAVDLTFDTIAGKHRAIAALNALGCGVVDESDHVHVQARRFRVSQT